jgi:hypothetical protein
MKSKLKTVLQFIKDYYIVVTIVIAIGSGSIFIKSQIENLATKDDVNRLETGIKRLENKMDIKPDRAELQGELVRMEDKADKAFALFYEMFVTQNRDIKEVLVQAKLFREYSKEASQISTKAVDIKEVKDTLDLSIGIRKLDR